MEWSLEQYVCGLFFHYLDVSGRKESLRATLKNRKGFMTQFKFDPVHASNSKQNIDLRYSHNLLILRDAPHARLYIG